MSLEVFLLPDVGEGLIEADIVTWKVAVGDTVTLNQPLCEVETAKAVVELPSPFAGVVVELHGKEGDTIAVDTPLVTIDASAEAASNAASEPAEEPAAGAGRTAVLIGYGVAAEDEVAPRRRRRTANTQATPVSTTKTVEVPVRPASAPRSTPPVRLFAKQNGLRIESITGTGPNGLITRSDVERAVGRTAKSPATVSGNATSRFVGRELDAWTSGEREERILIKGVLKTMAESMTSSSQTIPHAAVWVKVDATGTVELVQQLKSDPRFADVRVSPLTVVAMAVADAARKFPGINSFFDTQNGEVVVKRYVNLGIAADTPRGLVVPNIKDADRLDVLSMAKAINVLVEKARNGTTSVSDMSGTTFTVTNVGPFGVDAAVPIIPPGSAAILCVGQIAKAPWVVNDELAVRHVVEIALSFDHRQIDGALASGVLRHIGNFLEDPSAALLVG